MSASARRSPTACGPATLRARRGAQQAGDRNVEEDAMKTIGLIGGMSWESTLPYYRHINETVRAQLGGLHSAKLLLYSVDFHEIEQLQQAGDGDAAGTAMAAAAQALQAGGTDFLVL
jgi:hypothetical protein